MIDRQKIGQDQDPAVQKYKKLQDFRNRINEWGDVVPMVCFTDALIASGDTIQSLLPSHVILDDISPGNIIAALQYANAKTGGKVQDFYGLEDVERWHAIIAETLAKKEKADIFLENITRPQQMTSPRRGVALEYILRKRFGDKPVKGIDAGCGPHLALKLVGTGFLEDSFVEEELKKAGEVIPLQPSTIDVGLGIDISTLGDLNWVLASPWPLLSNHNGVNTLQEAIALANQKTDGFPFAQCDLTDELQSQEVITKHLDRVDFIHTSFLLGRMYGNVPEAEERFLPLVRDVLSEGGIWINFDTSTMIPHNSGRESYEVRVWEKRDGEVTLLAIPFVLENSQTDIGTVNVEEFRKI